jgi:hypothetical protein
MVTTAALLPGQSAHSDRPTLQTGPEAGPIQVRAVHVSAGYHPSSLTVSAGVPVRLVFRREGDESCEARVVFSAPRLERHLAADGETVVDLPALDRDVRFTCGMGRYRGRIRVVSAPTRRQIWARRAAASVGVATAAGLASLTAVAVWAGSAHAGLLVGLLVAPMAFALLHVTQATRHLVPDRSRGDEWR